jgi:hypothetical protein
MVPNNDSQERLKPYDLKLESTPGSNKSHKKKKKVSPRLAEKSPLQ